MADKSSAILALRNLGVRRGPTPILRDVDWTIHRGENWVILGPNGCGKTSLLAALTGYLTPTGGEIQVLDSVYGRTDWRELRKHVGFVSNALTRQIEPDESALNVVASGPSAVLNMWKQPTRAERRRALSLLRSWRSSHLADRPWGVLSQGERQRMLIMRALLAKPSLLLLDEPCAGLDPIARERLLAHIERIASRRKPRPPALVLITHHVEEITPSFTHVLLIKSGSIVAAGPIGDIMNSRALSDLFSSTLRLQRTGSRWMLQFPGR